MSNKVKNEAQVKEATAVVTAAVEKPANSYQKQKAALEEKQAKFIAEVEYLFSLIDAKKVEKDERAKAFAESYKDYFTAKESKRGGGFFELLFPQIGAVITAKAAFELTEGSVVLDARQLYQYRRKGFNIEKIKDAGLDSEFKYVSFDEKKSEEFYAAQKAKREAK